MRFIGNYHVYQQLANLLSVVFLPVSNPWTCSVFHTNAASEQF